jgi:hypothetical protein
MAEVLCVYREVSVMKESESTPVDVAIISYDERPGIQAIGNTAPDLPPQPGTRPVLHNARITLLATALNNVALAFIVAGFIAPAVTGQLPSGWRVLVTIAWIGLGVGIHLCAQLALGRLRQP